MWIIVAVVVGLVVWLALTLNNQKRQMKWYEWLIAATGILLLLFTIENYIGAQAEYLSQAGNLFLLVAGLPAIILLVIAWQLWARRNKIVNKVA